MRPLRIELQGFTAFRDHQVVELEDLDLFVITGPTGAGKTSLLDAMIFALYGRVPRAGRQSVRELVSQGVAEARVMFEFSLDGERYRIARRLPRKAAQSAVLERQDGDDWQREVETGGVGAVDARVAELVKLGFEAFTKAVVLPQGAFDRFLKGEPGKRREILTDLLGLKQYLRMGERARERGKTLRTRISATEEVLEQKYADVSEEALTGLKKTSDQAKVEAENLVDRAKDAARLEGEREELSLLASQIDGLQEELRTLEGDFEGMASDAQEAEANEKTLGQQLREAEKSAEQRQEELVTKKREFTELVEQSGDLEQLARVEGSLETVKGCQREQAELEEQLAATGQRAAQLSEALEKARARLDAATRELQQARDLAATATGKREEAKRLADELVQRLERVDEAVAEQAEERQRWEQASVRLEEARRAVGPAEEALNEARAKFERLEHENAAVVLARELEPGDPCPVCARPLEDHPSLEPVAAKSIDRAQRRRERALESQQQAIGELHAAEEAEGNAAAQRERGRIELEKKLGDYDGRDALAAAAGEARAKGDELKKADQAASDQLDAAQTEESDARTALTTVEGDLRACQGESAIHTESLEAIAKRRGEAEKLIRSHFAGEIPDDADERLVVERATVKEAQEGVADAEQQLADAQGAVNAAQTERQEAERELVALDARLAVGATKAEQARGDLLEACDKAKSGATVAALPRTVKARGTMATRLSEWCKAAGQTGREAKRDVDRAGKKAAEALLKLARSAGVKTDEPADVCEALRRAEAEAREEHGKRQGEVAAMDKRLEEKTDLNAKIQEQAAEAAVLNALGAELRSDRFVAFIQQETLDLLAARASEELLRISGNRYSLLSEEGNFEVVDHVNADEQRSVDTLSGGETFMASLSLALSLSRHVGELATEGMGAKLDAVFIDEGFGALDDETLEDVIDALERLREGELMVGVITHVPALAQRIREGLRITTSNGKASVELVSPT